MERYDASSGKWSAVAAMLTDYISFGASVSEGEIYVTGGLDMSSVEKYNPSSDTWTIVARLLTARSHHATATVGSFMYLLGGVTT
jgi:N-acetylneuraminic acid mutarotase